MKGKRKRKRSIKEEERERKREKVLENDSCVDPADRTLINPDFRVDLIVSVQLVGCPGSWRAVPSLCTDRFSPP